MYSSYGIAFDGAGWLSFGDSFARNIMIFGVDNRSSSHTHNRKSNFLVISEDSACGINGSFGSPEKNFSINFSKARTKF